MDPPATDRDETTLTVKKITSDAIDGTYEVEVTVDDFETTAELLRALGFVPKSYQETKRTSDPRAALPTVRSRVTSKNGTPPSDERRTERGMDAFWSAVAVIDPDDYRSSLVEDGVEVSADHSVEDRLLDADP